MQSRNSYIIVRRSIEILFLTILIIYSCRKIVLLFHYENILKAGDSDLTHSQCYLHYIYSLNSTNSTHWVYVLSVSSALNKGGAKFMGNVAVAMQEYLGDVERFADLFNGVFFHGEQVLAPEQLCEQSERYNMCKALMEIREEGREIGERIGDNSRTRIVVTNMLRRGYSTEDICAIAECSEQLVDELRESLSE